jgi:hypothetical protein
MKTLIRYLPVLLLGLLPFSMRAQQLPVLVANMTEIDVYTPPNTFASNIPTNTYGANVNAAGAGPTGGVNALNGGNCSFGSGIVVWGIATGLAPASGFTYEFFVNGISIGVASNTTVFSYDYGLAWTPPQPGVYFISVKATGNGVVANSIAVELYVYGLEIVSPLPGANVPLGSSVVIQAAASLNIGAVASVSFFDESGLLGSSRTFPYSIIYTPVGPANTVHFIHAVAYAADGSIAFTAPIPAQGVIMIPAVGPVPACSISTPQMQNVNGVLSPAEIGIPDYVADPQAYIPVIVDAGSGKGNIQQVQLYINGVLFGTNASYPYSFQWQPAVTGTYYITALAYDDKNNVIASTVSTTPTLTPAPTVVIVGSLPSVAIVSPGSGGTISGAGSGGGSATISASATDTNVDSSGNPVLITSVQFYQDGNLVGTATTGSNGVYTVNFTPVQKIDPTSGQPVESQLTAIATDSLGFQGVSAAISVNVNVGGTTVTTSNGTPPTVSISAPTDGSSVVVNTPVTLLATAASTQTPGSVSKVVFNVDGKLLTAVTSYPYSATWTPTNLGTYQITAQVTDNLGNVGSSQTVNVTVVTEPPPSVNITSPTAGGSATVSTPITVTANATSVSGTIQGIQFFENGISLGTSSTAPYSVTFTPASAGIYTLTAVATDNAGETSTSSPVIIEALPVESGLATTIYFGTYQGLSDGGEFAFIAVDGTLGTFIGQAQNNGAPTGASSFYSGMPITSAGVFSNASIRNGVVSSSGVTGTIAANQEIMIGSAVQPLSYAIASGYYTGSLGGDATSQITGIVGSDGEIMVYFADGTFNDTAYGVQGSVDPTGAFSVTTALGNTFTGVVNPTSGYLSGTLSGSHGGTVYGARVSGGTFSDGALVNISTRASVGTGANAMIPGFVVAGTSNKNLLIRAAGPTLASFGVTNAVPATTLQVYSGQTVIASNTGWSSTTANASAVTAANAASGAFQFPAGSLDSALVGSFAPGAYTAMVNGVNGATGTALVEVYDLDGYVPFTSKKLINVSTRGAVGTGNNNMIAGFVINGTAPKRLLIRAAGPGLGALGVTGALSNPHLEVIDNSHTLVRENFSWGNGNDPAMVAAAEKATGAFAYTTGSADSAILMVLPPGLYSAVVSGTGGATGIALVEVYEIP